MCGTIERHVDVIDVLAMIGECQNITDGKMMILMAWRSECPEGRTGPSRGWQQYLETDT